VKQNGGEEKSREEGREEGHQEKVS